MDALASPSGADLIGIDVEGFVRTLDEDAERMLEISDEEAGQPRAPGKWSRKEIVGHLIDSAVNNHARFVRARMQDDLVFDGYDQDAWVRLQNYGARSWPALVRAWRMYNLQIAEVMRHTSPGDLHRPRARHNLHEIAFRNRGVSGEATLALLMQDYVEHLRHHLRQVFDG